MNISETATTTWPTALLETVEFVGIWGLLFFMLALVMALSKRAI